MLLEVKEIDMTYPKSDRKIFENISLNIDRGSFTVVTGPSGSGNMENPEGGNDRTSAKCRHRSGYPDHRPG